MTPVPGADPAVTVLIPAREEAGAIDRCLAHVLAQDWPHDDLEVIVVDGGSRDATAARARAALAASDVARWSVVTNAEGTTPSNLNRGLAEARGRYVCRVDARSFIPPDYVSACVGLLAEDPEVRAAGGRQVAWPRDGSARARGIARALNNRLSMGGARYRGLGGSGPVDTVYLGVFRTDQLREAGGWDPRFLTNQDFELNRRIVAGGGAVWLIDRLEVGYQPRATLGEVARQYLRFGSWKVRYWRTTGDAPRPRQVALLAAPPVAAAAGLGLLAVASPRQRALLAAAGVGGALAVEHVGGGGAGEGEAGDRAPAGPGARAWAVATMVCVSGGWSIGVWREWLLGDRRGLPAPVGGGEVQG